LSEPARFEGVLVILADGARPDVMQRMAAAGEMPFFQRHFVDCGGFRHATSVFPTVSGPAHLPVLTGIHPGQANLPGIRWAERPVKPRAGFLGRTRSYMAPFRASKLARDIPSGVGTLFQHIPAMADVNTWFVRGCPSAARRTRFSKAGAFLRSFATKDWYSSDNQAEGAVQGAFGAGFTSAFSVFPAVDELGHRFGPLTPESFEAYRRFDILLGKVFDGLARRGRADKTLVMLTSDHGQTATQTHVDLDPLVEKIYPRTVSYPKFWRHWRDADAGIMVSGNSMANIYLRGVAGWQEKPDPSDPADRAAELVEVLLAHEAIDLVIHRTPVEGSYVVRKGTGRRHLRVSRRQAGAAAENVETSCEGADPFAIPELTGTFDRHELGRLSAASDYPDAVWQVAEFFRSPRAGDLVVCAKPGFDLRSRFEYQPHLGSHGSLNREHMMVPAAVNARWSGEDPLRSVDLFPSVLAALGRPVPEGLDGETRVILSP
jgi:hypothetical protein